MTDTDNGYEKIVSVHWKTAFILQEPEHMKFDQKRPFRLAQLSMYFYKRVTPKGN